MDKPTQQSFFYGDDPKWVQAQKRAYNKTGLKWPPQRRNYNRRWVE